MKGALKLPHPHRNNGLVLDYYNNFRGRVTSWSITTGSQTKKGNCDKVYLISCLFHPLHEYRGQVGRMPRTPGKSIVFRYLELDPHHRMLVTYIFRIWSHTIRRIPNCADKVKKKWLHINGVSIYKGPMWLIITLLIISLRSFLFQIWKCYTITTINPQSQCLG